MLGLGQVAGAFGALTVLILLVVAALAAVFLGLGFWHVYFRKAPACEDDSYCARPSSLIVTKTVLWSATVLIILTATMGWWAPLFY